MLPPVEPMRRLHLPFVSVIGIVPLHTASSFNDGELTNDNGSSLQTGRVPLPLPSPAGLRTAPPPEQMISPPQSEALPGVPFPQPRPFLPGQTSESALAPVLPAAKLDSCTTLLASGQVEAEFLPPLHKGQCSIAEPVLVKAIKTTDGQSITIEPAAILHCKAAASVAVWVRMSVAPKALSLLGEAVVGLRNAASFDCRGRNRQAGAKLSEHGYGRALDVGAFRTISGEWIEVRSPGKAQPFIAGVRKDLCGPFTTVLGPGSDVFHSDHLHMDVAERRKTGRSKGLVCR
jgi:hypothetical protein